MHRQNLLSLLHKYAPSCEEVDLKKRMIEFINNYSDCFERTLEIGHITASAWLLNKDQSKALLMHHTKLNKWLQLGGHCDGNSDALSMALKEAQEESGIQNIVPIQHHIFDIDIHKIPENKKEKEHYHYDVRFLLAITTDEQLIQNHESKALKWINKIRDELPTNERSVRRMFEKWIAYERT